MSQKTNISKNSESNSETEKLTELPSSTSTPTAVAPPQTTQLGLSQHKLQPTTVYEVPHEIASFFKTHKVALLKLLQNVGTNENVSLYE